MPDPEDVPSLTDALDAAEKRLDAPAPDAEVVVEEVVQDEPKDQEVDDGVDQFLERARAGKISGNDPDMVGRWKTGYQEAKTLRDELAESKRELDELRGRETYSDTAERIFTSIEDSNTKAEHRAFRAQHGDREYIAAVERQQREKVDRGMSEPEETAQEKELRELREKITSLESNDARRVANEQESRFQTDTKRALGDGKIPEKVHEYLTGRVKDAVNRVASTKPVRTYEELQVVVKSEWEALKPFLNLKDSASEPKMVDPKPLNTPRPTTDEGSESPEEIGDDSEEEAVGKMIAKAEKKLPQEGND